VQICKTTRENIEKNTMRTAEETVMLVYFGFKKETSARLSLPVLIATFFGKVIVQEEYP